MEYKIFKDNIRCQNIDRKFSNVAVRKFGSVAISKKSSRKKKIVVSHNDFLKRNLWIKYYLVSFILLISYFGLQDFFEIESSDKVNIKNELAIENGELALESNVSKKNQAKNTQDLSLTLKFYKTDPIKIRRDAPSLEKKSLGENQFLYSEQGFFDFNLDKPL